MGKRWSNQKGSFRRHLNRLHQCKCGREFRGNGFYNHAKSCPEYQVWKAIKDKELAELLSGFGY